MPMKYEQLSWAIRGGEADFGNSGYFYSKISLLGSSLYAVASVALAQLVVQLDDCRTAETRR